MDEAELNSQIERFEWHIKTHILDVAAVLASGFRLDRPPLNNSGFFILSGVIPYYEAIGQHILGDDDNAAFITGFADVYRCQLGADCDKVATKVKQNIRHGLFHDGTVRGQITLSRCYPSGVAVVCGELQINPFLLVQDIAGHFPEYIMRLSDPAFSDLRLAFTRRREKINRQYAPIPTMAPTTSSTNTATTATQNPNDPNQERGNYGSAITTQNPNDPNNKHGQY